MSKYHIGKNGPGLCKATKRACPVGGEHFDSKADAEKHYEKMNENNKISKPLSKSKNHVSAPINFEKYKFPKNNTLNGLQGSYTLKEYRNYLQRINDNFSDYKADIKLKNDTLKILTPNSDALKSHEDFDYTGNGMLYITTSVHEGLDEEYYDEIDATSWGEYSNLSASPYFSNASAVKGGYYNEEIIYTVKYDLSKSPELKQRFDEYYDYNKKRASIARLQMSELPDWAALPVAQTTNWGNDLNNKFKNELSNHRNVTTFLNSIGGNVVNASERMKDKGKSESKVAKARENTIERLSYFYPSNDRVLRVSEATKWVDSHPELIGRQWPVENHWEL